MLPLNRQRLLHKRQAADRPQTAFTLPTRRYGPVLAHHLTVVVQGDRDVEARQRDAADHLIDMAEFSLFSAHKLAARRGVIEEIEHFKRRARRMSGGLHRHRHLPPFGIGLPGLRLVGGAGG